MATTPTCSPETPQAAGAGIGAVGLLDVLRGMMQRRKRLVVLSTLLFSLLGLAVIMVSEPIYTATSQVLIENEDTPYTRSGVALQTQPRQITERDVRSQVEVIRSHDLGLKVLRELRLLGTPEFDPVKRGLGPLRRLKIMLGFAPDPRRQTPEQRALAVWDKRLKAYNLPKTQVIVIEFSSSSPKTAAAVANAVARAYVEQTRATRLARTNQAREWLKQQIEKLRRKVVEAERAVESYRAKAGLFQGVQARLHNQELSELSAQIVRAAAERSQAEAKAKAIRRLLARGQVEKSADVLRSQLIQRLREQQVQIRRRLAELSTTYLDNHPRVRAVRRELADLKRQINAEARKIAESLEEQARIAATREAELRARLARMKKQVSSAQISEVKLRELEREAKAQRSLLESFLARYTDAMTREDKQALPGMARIIARAFTPASPSFPKPGPIMLLSLLAGLVLGMGLAFILEVMAAVREAEQVAASGNVTTLQGAPANAASIGSAVGMQGHAHEQAPRHATPAAAAETAQEWPAAQSVPTVLAQETTGHGISGEMPAHGHAAQAPEGGMPAAGVGRAGLLQERIDTVVGGRAGVSAAERGSGRAAQAPQPAHRGNGASMTQPEREPVKSSTAVMADKAAEQLQAWHENENLQRLALTSLALAPGDDVAITLKTARKLASRYRVILLDGPDENFRLPFTAQRPGLADLLAGKAGFADIMRADTAVGQLHVLAAGHSALPKDGFRNTVMTELLRALEENYDIVLMHEGMPRYPLDVERSFLPLAQGAVVLHAAQERPLAEGLRASLAKQGEPRVALVGDDLSQTRQDTAHSRLEDDCPENDAVAK